VSCLAQGFDHLVKKTSQGIIDFFKDRGEIKTSIIKFENYSGLSDLMAQKYYQLITANLEMNPHINFTDLMINFSKNKGEFNLSRTDKLNYLIYLKLKRNRDKIGTGISIFSRTLDKIVYVRYFEDFISEGEKDVLNIQNYGFQGQGFFKQIEMDVKRDLLDVESITFPDGAPRYFMYYPGKIDIYRDKASSFKKVNSLTLDWKRPYFPVINFNGQLYLFYHNRVLYMAVGGNFSPYSMVFRLQEAQWNYLGNIKFIPIRLIGFNNGIYLVGVRYVDGTNFFQGNLVLLPFDSGRFSDESLIEKPVVPFYSVDFATSVEGELETVHIVDTDYNYRFYGSDLIEQSLDAEKRGSSLSVLQNQWLCISDYSEIYDTLFFYKILDGRRQLVYKNLVNGEVKFISSGSWKRTKGFWAYIKKGDKRNWKYFLQFWGKQNE
jgi:hypothetical protein